MRTIAAELRIRFAISTGHCPQNVDIVFDGHTKAIERFICAGRVIQEGWGDGCEVGTSSGEEALMYLSLEINYGPLARELKGVSEEQQHTCLEKSLLIKPSKPLPKSSICLLQIYLLHC
jgi:hypothetical protein